MHSNGGGDARSGIAPRLPSSVPFDHSPTDMWERQAFLSFDCAERDKYTSAKRDWLMDARASSTRSSNTLFSNVGSSGSSAKRRAVGRHGRAHDNGRYGSGVCRPLNISSHIRSPPENDKADRDFLSSAGGPSPGYSSSLRMEKPGKDSDGIHLRGSQLSPPEIRPASSPCFDRSPVFDPPRRLYGMQNACEGPVLWERDRSKLSIVRETSFRDKEKFGGRPEYHRRTYSLPKLDSPKDWSGGDRELLEGRVDRYGSASSRELAFSDVLSISNKEHYRYDWRTRDRSLFGGFSSRPACAPSSNSHLKDIGAAPARLEQPRPSTPPYQLAAQNSFSDQVNRDFDAGPTSPKKRPRLAWGQGLAKYEKEKIEEDHYAGKKCEDGHHVTAESHEDVHASSDCQSRLTENGSFSPLHDQHREQDSCDSGTLSGCEFERSSTPKDLAIGHSLGTHEPFLLDHSKANVGQLGPSVSSSEYLPFLTAAPQASILHEVQVFLSSFWRERPTLSKDVLTHHMEKVEQEIDRLEKELVKLGSDQVEEIVSTYDTSNSKVEVHGESCDTSVSASETQLTHCEDASAIVVASAENLPLLHSVNVHVQLPEASATQSDYVLDSGLGVYLPAVQSGELQCEGGFLRPDLEVTSSSSDKDLGLVESILVSNSHTAEMSLASLAHLNSPKISAILESGRLYSSPQQSDIWRLNEESHSRKRKHFQFKVLEKKVSVNFLEKVLAVKFMAHREAWQQKQCGVHFRMEDEKHLKITKAQQGDDADSPAHQSSLKSWFASGFNSEEVHTVKMLKVSSYTEDNRDFLRMPAMRLGRERELHNFESKNSLVDDPISAEQERKFINPWSKEEKSIFLEKYSLFGKDFRRIASYLEHKTVADCVEFYYRNQKNQEFESVHHKHRLEKQCRFQLEKYNVEKSAFYLATNPFIDSRHCEDTSCLEGLSLVAAAAAAMSAPTTKPTYCGLATQACIKVAPKQFAVKGFRNVECNGARITHSQARTFNEALDVEWSDSETNSFMNAVVLYGKDFDSISRHMGTRSVLQCQSFFNKACRLLGLDELVERHQVFLPASSEKGAAEVDVPQQQCTDANFSAAFSESVASAELLQVSRDSKDANALESLQEVCKRVCVSPKINAFKSGSHVLDYQIIQEACTISDGGEKGSSDLSACPRITSGSHVSNAPLLDPGKTCNLNDSLVCGETLQFKSELVSGKAEPLPTENGTFNRGFSDVHIVSAPLRAPSGVPTFVPIAASAVESTQNKDHTLKVSETKVRREPTSWTQAEKDKFVEVLKIYGKDWDRLRQCLPGKSLTQIKTYFQNSKAKLGFGSEGVVGGNGKVRSSRKRKVDDSDSSSNAGSGGHNASQKGPVHSDDGNIKVSPTLFVSSGDVGSYALAAELMYANSSSRDLVGDSDKAQKILQSEGLNSSTPVVGINPFLKPALFACSNLQGPQQVYGNPNAPKVQLVVLQQPQQVTSPSVLVQPVQQHQLQQPSPSQPALRVPQELRLPVVQHLYKQRALLQSEANLQTLLHQHQQQVVQQLQQQVTEAILKEYLPALLMQGQQLQMVAQQVPHNHFQQMPSQHQAQASEQALNQVVTTQLVSGRETIANTQQLQQQAESLESLLYQMHIKPPPLLQQQQVSQQLQLLQLHWQQQQAQLQQVPAKQVPNHLSHLQPLNVSFYNEQQQQSAVSNGIMQVTSAYTEAMKQSDSDKFSKAQQGPREGLHQLPSNSQWSQALSKFEAVSKSQMRAMDVKLFGQSLLSQPASGGQQQSAKVSTLSPQITFPGAPSSLASGKSIIAQPPSDALTHGLGWPQLVWPVAPFVNDCSSTGLSNGLAFLGSGGDESRVCSVPEAVDRTNEMLILGAKSNEIDQAKGFCPAVATTGQAPNSRVMSSMLVDSMRRPCDMERPYLESSKSVQDCRESANKHSVQDSQPSSVAPGQGAIQGLPRALDALVALAEWQIQNANVGGGKDLLGQSWEALQRDPGSLVEAGKALAQMYTGNGDLKDGLSPLQPPPMHLFAGGNGGGSTAYLNSVPDWPSQSSSLLCNGEHDVREVEGKGVAG